MNRGSWCKPCPAGCVDCLSGAICLTCLDYYSLHPIFKTCLLCNIDDQCLGCDVMNVLCTKCVLGYRPTTMGCSLIEPVCGDGFMSLIEGCDDGNLVEKDGCSSTCTVEENFSCRLTRNEGPSLCFDTSGWVFEL